MKNKNTLALGGAIAIALASSACTTTERVSVMQPGDRAMTCAAMRTEFARLEAIKRDAQSDQGVNGANVAGFLLFPLAIAGNYLTARDAMNLAEERRTYLMEIYNEKDCDNPQNANLVFRVPLNMLTPEARTIGVSN